MFYVTVHFNSHLFDGAPVQLLSRHLATQNENTEYSLLFVRVSLLGLILQPAGL